MDYDIVVEMRVTHKTPDGFSRQVFVRESQVNNLEDWMFFMYTATKSAGTYYNVCDIGYKTTDGQQGWVNNLSSFGIDLGEEF